MEKSKLDRLLGNLDKQCIKILVIIYILKVYGSLILYNCDLITAVMWENIHFIGVQIILILFLFRLRRFTDRGLYAVGMGLFTSRLFTQINGGVEYIYEMPLVIIISLLIYYISKKWNLKK